MTVADKLILAGVVATLFALLFQDPIKHFWSGVLKPERQLVINLDPDTPDEGRVQPHDFLYWTIAYRGPGTFRLGRIYYHLRDGSTVHIEETHLDSLELHDGEGSTVWTELRHHPRSAFLGITVTDQSGRRWRKNFS